MMNRAVYKFGGAAVNGAERIKNVAKIIQNYTGEELLVVISAIGDTTNELELVVQRFLSGDVQGAETILEKIRSKHFELADQLLGSESGLLITSLSNALVEIEWLLEEGALDAPEYIYDQIVSVGEILSTLIVSAYLQSEQMSAIWLDARSFIKTDNNYREANIDWELTEKEINGYLEPVLLKNIVVTQGFIGSSSENFTTTLGRDGSDYSASIFCACLAANALTIWKDVPGVLNADPKWFDETEQISELSYTDAIELSYYGANVIHPKTLKPLQNKGIPLFVKSFIDPDGSGTQIASKGTPLPIPSYIFKVHQVLISIFPKDFSFIIEENLSIIFRLFHERRVKINTMQNSALSFSVSVDDQGTKTDDLIAELGQTFKVRYNKNLELVTIRHYNQDTIERISINKTILLEVKSRYTCQMVMRDEPSVK